MPTSKTLPTKAKLRNPQIANLPKHPHSVYHEAIQINGSNKTSVQLAALNTTWLLSKCLHIKQDNHNTIASSSYLIYKSHNNRYAPKSITCRINLLQTHKYTCQANSLHYKQIGTTSTTLLAATPSSTLNYLTTTNHKQQKPYL
eukprot:gene2918-1900_t